ncbi:histidine phosphatase family protein [Pontiella sulfatireligans]|uniref:EF-hand domain-containing protein n=1 Tax=Pontiella sulfatireligans TaxID=2750658 RepID=A0A6C2UDX0_9BACT|nr:histidine phosphatase family protein [Pontiella sulfatireligans]VGO18335.1 hypothetical protein SCARR_00387 [Pontiella sulfatireligans]
MKKRIFTGPVAFMITLSTVLLGASVAEAGLKIYYIRHAEAGHNVKKDWEKRKVPKDQWPAYVGNADMFTPKGLEQRAATAGKLKKYHFDFIAASPMWRCQNTILPYMQETGSKGEIWPELREGRASALILDTSLPVPTEPILGAGKPLEVGAEESPCFSLREDGKNAFKVPKAGTGRAADERSSAVARVVIQRVLDMIQTRFGGTDKSILFAGHGSSGKSVLRMLTQDPLTGFEGISNTGIWMVEEQADGTFKLKLFNDELVDHDKPVSVAPSKHASMDADNDGRVTQAEYVAEKVTGFERKDKNNDGVLSPDEHTHKSFKGADLDHNGQLTREEFSAIFKKRFDNKYDKNKVGFIAVEEIK